MKYFINGDEVVMPVSTDFLRSRNDDSRQTLHILLSQYHGKHELDAALWQMT